MGDVRIIVDHLKLEYSGVFNTKDMFKLIGTWFNDRFIQKRESKNFEQNLADGKYIEYEIQYWKKITDYHRFIYKLRLLMFGLKKVEIVENDKKISVDQGRALFYLDGYIEFDYEHRWEVAPMLQFFRVLYDKFLYKFYTERFEQRLTYDMHQLYDTLERFFNMYRHYRPVTKVPHFAH
ncbi:MAG TPA: hypothetical protein VJH97_05460 [Candidatus Nanoarchaeia archaeon]|nr:hypothetical protein [Candidatus Nanoarchaeia archaeon]